MNENKKECDYCGALCDINDTYCKKCSHNFINDTNSTKNITESAIDEFENNDVKRFIGKNADYYDFSDVNMFYPPIKNPVTSWQMFLNFLGIRG